MRIMTLGDTYGPQQVSSQVVTPLVPASSFDKVFDKIWGIMGFQNSIASTTPRKDYKVADAAPPILAFVGVAIGGFFLYKIATKK